MRFCNTLAMAFICYSTTFNAFANFARSALNTQTCMYELNQGTHFNIIMHIDAVNIISTSVAPKLQLRQPGHNGVVLN